MLIRLIKLFISGLLYFCDQLGSTLLKIVGKTPSGTCVVLYYHSILPQDTASFYKQLCLIARHTIPVSIEEDKDLIDDKKYCAVTFDDGFANIFENALPLMKQFSIPAAVFIPTAYVGSSPNWIADENSETLNQKLANRKLIQKWQNSISIGSHTVSHPDITTIPYDQIRSELYESKRYLEELIGRDINCLSFPHGRYNAAVLELAFKANYRKIFTINPICYVSNFKNQIIGRVSASPSDWKIEFFLKLSGSYRWMSVASKIKGYILS